MAESMEEEGVSGERVMRAEAALRIDGEGWEGPGGGGAGMRRMLSIRRAVGERRWVRVGLVVEGGSEVRCRVGFGWGLEDSESVGVSSVAVYGGLKGKEGAVPESSSEYASFDFPNGAEFSNASSPVFPSLNRLFSRSPSPPGPPNTPPSSSPLSNAASRFRFLPGGPAAPPRVLGGGPVKCRLPGPLGGPPLIPLNPPPPRGPFPPNPPPPPCSECSGSSSKEATKSL